MSIQINFVKLDILPFFRYVRSFPNAEALGADILKLADALVLGKGDGHPYAAELLEEARNIQGKRSAAGKKGMFKRWGKDPGDSDIPEAPNPPAPKPPKVQKAKRGEYKNVPLTDEELATLRAELPDADLCIEELSGYMARSGKTYRNYLATVRNWSVRRVEFSRQHGGAQVPFAEMERQRAANIARQAFPDTMEKYGLDGGNK